MSLKNAHRRLRQDELTTLCECIKLHNGNILPNSNKLEYVYQIDTALPMHADLLASKRKILTHHTGLWAYVIRLCYFTSIIIVCSSVKIKIIDGPFSLQNAGLQTQQVAPPDVKLSPKVKPQKISGPPHLFTLSGRCFKLQKTSFKYEFCPFHNITQREQSYRWNAFHGILGIWKEWKIVNDTFEYMFMTNGETCIGEIQREVMVYFKCGAEEKFMDIEEPRICRYNVTFQTPLACAEDAFMVYPTLTDAGRREWDEIEDSFIEEELTLQGYNKRRRKLFLREGLMEEKTKNAEVKSLTSSSSDKNNEEDRETYKKFNREQCIEEYEKLLQEVKKLRKELNSCQAVNDTKVLESSKNKSSVKEVEFVKQPIKNDASDDQISQDRKSMNQESRNHESRIQESRNHESRSHESRNQESRNHESQSHESKDKPQNRKAEENGTKRMKSSNEKSRNHKARNRELLTKEQKNRKSQHHVPLDKESGIQESLELHSWNQRFSHGSLSKPKGDKGLPHMKDKQKEMQAKISKKTKKGKMGDEGMSKQVPFKVTKKHRNGKMGDNGANIAVKRYEKLQGHYLGQFLENARKRIDKSNTENKSIDEQHNHIYH